MSTEHNVYQSLYIQYIYIYIYIYIVAEWIPGRRDDPTDKQNHLT